MRFLRVVGLCAAFTVIVAISANAAEERSNTERAIFEYGKFVYDRNCIACHRASGQGIPPAFPSLVDSGVLRSTDDLVQAILLGKPRTAMPGFKQLSIREIAAVATYVRGWSRAPLPVVSGDDVIRVAGAAGTSAAEIELMRARRGEERPEQEFSGFSLDSSELAKPVAIGNSLKSLSELAGPGGLNIAGRIVRSSENRYLLLMNYAPLWHGYGTPKDVPKDGMAGLVYLAPCSVVGFSKSRGFTGWVLRGPIQTPDRRFISALEIELSNPAVASAAGKQGGVEIVGVNQEFDSTCRRIMRDWDAKPSTATSPSQPGGSQSATNSGGGGRADPARSMSAAQLSAILAQSLGRSAVERQRRQEEIDQSWDAAHTRMIAATGNDPIRYHQLRIAESAARYRGPAMAPIPNDLNGEAVVRVWFRERIPIPHVELLTSSGDGRVDDAARRIVLNGAAEVRVPVSLRDKEFHTDLRVIFGADKRSIVPIPPDGSGVSERRSQNADAGVPLSRALASEVRGVQEASGFESNPGVIEFQRQLEQTTSKYKRYPTDAMLNGWEGVATVRLKIASDGKIAGVDVANSSGHHVLDEAAKIAVTSAKPFVQVPALLRGTEFVATIPVAFRLLKN